MQSCVAKTLICLLLGPTGDLPILVGGGELTSRGSVGANGILRQTERLFSGDIILLGCDGPRSPVDGSFDDAERTGSLCRCFPVFWPTYSHPKAPLLKRHRRVVRCIDFGIRNIQNCIEPIGPTWAVFPNELSHAGALFEPTAVMRC